MHIVSQTGPSIPRTRPVYFMHEVGVPAAQIDAVLTGINNILRLSGVQEKISVHNFGVWRNQGWLEGNKLTNWNSVDWYLEIAKLASRNESQLNGDKLLKLLYSEPWQEKRPHYDVVVTKRDLNADDCAFCIGLAIHGVATAISTFRFTSLDANSQRECIITETMHEMGHVFGLVPAGRKEAVEMSLGLHCTNTCIMRQGLRVPHDWLRITEDRLRGNVLCSYCQRDLLAFFAN